MALQLHRLFISGSLYGNFSNSSHLPSMMSQCRSFQNYPSIFMPCSPFGGGGYKYPKGAAEVKFRKSSLESCRVTESKLRCLRFTAERELCLFRNVTDGYNKQVSSLNFETHVGVGFPCIMKHFSNGYSESSFRSSSLLYKCVGRRFSTVKAIQKSQVTRKLVSVKDNVGVSRRKSGGIRSSLMGFHKFPREKPGVVCCSISDGGLQVAVSSKSVVKKRAQNTKKPVATVVDVSKVNGNGNKDTKSVSKQPAKKSTRKSTAKTVDVPNSQKQVNGEVMSDSAVSMTSKSSSIREETKAQGKTKQKVGKTKPEKTLLSASIPSGAEKTKGSKRTSRVTKSNDPNNGTCSPTLENITEGETPLPALSDTSLVHHQPKKTTVSSTKKKKSRATKSVKAPKKVKVPKKQVNGVPVEVNTNLPGRTIGPLYPPSGKSVVVVESVTKAKVIQGYLGDMFEVLPSYGHVRDLAGRSGSVLPDDDFSMVWEVPAAAWTHLNNIKVALNGASNLILASDPDREGEAIAWHITEMLRQQDAVNNNITVARVVFHEITEASIKSALQNPRDIDSNLVYAYLARRALDYLIGFNISPLLWRKLPGCQSAGRVQSAALALICDREMEIDACKPQEYWTIDVEFNKKELGKTFSFSSHLTHFECRKLEQLSISSDAEAKDIEQKITTSNLEVVNFKRGQTRKNPPAPYITSTLQQDAANKLHFTSSYTMKLAQKLYEGVKLSDGEATGLITYMRTDGMHVSDGAAESIRSLVIERYGEDFASESTRKYFKKVKNAQEAHEAIRPTSIQRFPSLLAGVLDEDSMKLYTLIWTRTMACQMEPTVIDQVQVDIGGGKESLVLRSTCSRIGFLGYRAVYKDKEAAAIGDKEKEGSSHEAFDLLCTLKLGDTLDRGKVELKQHFTQPPSRYSEGSLVKKLEELGIGRPSTYATTIKVLQDRRYLTVKSRVLYPEFRGRMVSAFLSHHFSEVTNYSFTADMESELDSVSAGTTEWKGLLKDYWARFRSYCDLAGSVDIRQVEKMLEGTFGDLVFASLPNKNRTCPSCLQGTLIFKVSRFGSGYFLGCDQHPKCKYIAKTMYGDDEEGDTSLKIVLNEPKLLGLDASSNEKILLKSGPFGFYVQFGEDRKGYVPKRASVSKIKDVGSITLEDALELLRYPITLGNHPEDKKPVDLRFARYGFSIKHGRTNVPVPEDMNAKEITLEEALKLLLSDNTRVMGRPKWKPKKEAAL